MRIALGGGFPPMLLAGLRFVAAGSMLYAVLRARGVAPPTRVEWRSSLFVGTLLVCANGCVAVAEQWVSSGVAAVAIASVPLWVALFAGLFGRWPSRGESIGLAVGLGGVLLLQTGGELRASPAGAAVLTVSCLSWSLGSIYSGRLQLPKGLISSPAHILLVPLLVVALALLRGDLIAAVPPPPAVVAL